MTRLSLKSVSSLNSSTELMGTDWRLLRRGGLADGLTHSPMLCLADVTIRRHVGLQWQKVMPTQIEFCAVFTFLPFFCVQINYGMMTAATAASLAVVTLTRREDMQAPMMGTSVPWSELLVERGRTGNASHSHSQHVHPSA